MRPAAAEIQKRGQSRWNRDGFAYDWCLCWFAVLSIGMTRETIGYHIVKSGYGLWLPGDDRGSWSDAWDEMIGFVDPHTLNDGDPVRKRMAHERMKHKPMTFDDVMIDIVLSTINKCENNSKWHIASASLLFASFHFFFVM